MYAEVFVILVSFVLNICSHAADKAHRAGITVFSIGVGDKIQLQTLNTIASNPDCTHVFSVATYTEIKAIKEEIQKSSCQGEHLVSIWFLGKPLGFLYVLIVFLSVIVMVYLYLGRPFIGKYLCTCSTFRIPLFTFSHQGR
jgi:hypothetical protein